MARFTGNAASDARKGRIKPIVSTVLNLTERQVSLSLPDWKKDKSIIEIEKEKITPWLISLYNVSICEHLRWNASHIMLGYVTMTDEVQKLSAAHATK